MNIQEQNSTIILKTDWSSYFIFSLLSSIFLTLGLMISLKRPDEWQFILLMFVFAIFPHIWLSAFKIVISPKKLYYRSLFSFRNEIAFSEITKAIIEVGKMDKNQPFYCLKIFDCKGHSESPIVINLKPFSFQDIAKLTKAIVENSPSTSDISKDIIGLSKKDLLPLRHQMLKKIWKVGIFVFFLIFILSFLRALFLKWG